MPLGSLPTRPSKRSPTRSCAGSPRCCPRTCAATTPTGPGSPAEAPTLDRVEVLLARENGFCFGVKKAVELTQAAAESGRPVFNLGQVVHNPKISERLAARGGKVISDPAAAESGIVVIRAHGVPPAMRASIAQ